MDELTKEYVISYFTKTLRMHGDRAEAVGWTSVGQHRRFEGLLEIAGSINGKKILDYGCGKGDFYQFLKARNIAVEYTGLDINAGLIELAKQKFPECKFRVFDIEQDILHEDFDYIFLCGVFNLKVERLLETVQNTLIKLFHHCRKGLAFNGLSAHNPKKDFEINYFFPEDIIAFALRNLSPYAALRHDRMLYDFTLLVSKDKEK
ncbi:MAG: class I SAM-dependent methyltransferase [Nitrospiraceae bacterium]|nr:MAG: class I SAM-dependent methyltransferase [Nitrospiraceae bacterium]